MNVKNNTTTKIEYLQIVYLIRTVKFVEKNLFITKTVWGEKGKENIVQKNVIMQVKQQQIIECTIMQKLEPKKKICRLILP